MMFKNMFFCPKCNTGISTFPSLSCKIFLREMSFTVYLHSFYYNQVSVSPEGPPNTSVKPKWCMKFVIHDQYNDYQPKYMNCRPDCTNFM